jgi:hypothetical protein
MELFQFKGRNSFRISFFQNHNQFLEERFQMTDSSTIRNLSDTKLLSFAIGQQKKSRFQKAREDKELKKKIDEEEAAKVYETFVESFKHDDTEAKKFIKGGESSYKNIPDSSAKKKAADAMFGRKNVRI